MLKEIQTARLNEERKGGLMVAKDLVWDIVVLARGTKRTSLSKERNRRCEVADKGERM